MATISVVSDVKNKVILLIDDVTTTGGSMIACVNLLKSKGARTVLPLALLETANYEE
ncbi:TPA: phosphoribosyltransferase [Salmonella enterica subsp. enterica serovar Typhimurium]|nr:phosphoribosyltransferase [Salmonella enterica]EAW1941355.1 phosphoribosyltransferase [Salmonella enterica subsp. enterica]EBH9616952.1 phosphoribosyltransferase [Salmonella enterica subsp. enterica serovar Hartford]EBZ7465138.1 phosphoribosyltransferase [Salmonella enterica subsp. enterica serovar Mbandaka]ECM6921030.1 phosphoribosyltransferase [Salmonella enterica subsp. enterica serovar Typhimurium]EDO1563107.1 phosphoribosyltransferase [Salmonella enterica subsp. enterica serovar Oranie